jgi:hypothetical protein
MRKKILRYSLLILVAAFVIMQFFRIDKTNPEAVPAEDFFVAMTPPEDIKTLIENSCYDCHSHHTTYPWYSNIVPVSWWLKDHIDHGRKHLNFSVWTTYSTKKAAHKMEECFEEVGEGEMPLKSYLLTHGEARMSETDKNKLVAWFKTMYKELEKEEHKEEAPKEQTPQEQASEGEG